MQSIAGQRLQRHAHRHERPRPEQLDDRRRVSGRIAGAAGRHWVFSPGVATVSDTVFFNADAVKPAAGHKLVQFTWNFGDGTTAADSRRRTCSRRRIIPGRAERARRRRSRKRLPHTIVIVGSGNPTPAFTSLVQTARRHTMFFDGRRVYGRQWR